MSTTMLNMAKLRAWPLLDGSWLVIVFLREEDGRLCLLEEVELETEEDVQKYIVETQERMRLAIEDLPGVEGVHAQFAGAKKA